MLPCCRHLNAHDVSESVQQELKHLAAALNAGDGSAAKRIQVGRFSKNAVWEGK